MQFVLGFIVGLIVGAVLMGVILVRGLAFTQGGD